MPHSDTIIDGKRFPSVTEIVGILDKPFLAFWRGKIGNAEADRISKESTARGRNVHELIDYYFISGQVPTCGVSEEERKLFDAWWKWFSDKKYKAIASEKKVISKKYKYGGTFDAILED